MNPFHRLRCRPAIAVALAGLPGREAQLAQGRKGQLTGLFLSKGCKLAKVQK